MTFRLGIDIGGTFTDYSLLDQSSGRLISYKSPTTPNDLAEGVVAGLRELAQREHVDLGDIEYFVHGTTIGLNAIIQRRGATLALIVTEGFRDILELQRLRLASPMKLTSLRTAPLIPRWRVLEVRERVLTNGSIDIPLDRSTVEAALRAARAMRVDGLVVCLINAYRNPMHEQAIRAIAHEVATGLYVCCSHEVWPQHREYERAMATTLNAFVQPTLSTYLDGLVDRLRHAGLTTEPYITKSNGGVMTARSARDAPVETLLSGPASGVIGAVYAAGLSGYRDLITFDVGGTSADIAVVQGGEPEYSHDEHVGDFPMVLPSVRVSSVGAGGGSVAWFDSAGLLKVGPRSAGAEPGPACYGRGGTEPTLTDAFLVTGLLNADGFLGGRIRLHDARARAAIQPIATELRLDLGAAAEAVIEVALTNMYGEFSEVMAARGIDPRDFTIVAFGGAGPVLACFLAAEFHIPRVLVPPRPGTLCALGALSADVKTDYVKTLNLRVEDARPSDLREYFADLRTRAETWLSSEGPGLLEKQFLFSADVRYRYQAYEIEVEVDPLWLAGDDLDPLVQAFHRRHEQVYAHADPAEPIELISIHVKVVGKTPKPTSRPVPIGERPPSPSGRRAIQYRGQHHTAAVFQRNSLLAGHDLSGPAIIEQDDTTILLPAGFYGKVDAFGNVLISVGVDETSAAPSLVGAEGRRG